VGQDPVVINIALNAIGMKDGRILRDMENMEKKKFDEMESALKVIRTWASYGMDHFEEMDSEWHKINLMHIRDKCTQVLEWGRRNKMHYLLTPLMKNGEQVMAVPEVEQWYIDPYGEPAEMFMSMKDEMEKGTIGANEKFPILTIHKFEDIDALKLFINSGKKGKENGRL
jgi:hypothetical protein